MESEAINENEELIEKDIRDRFKKMCHGYYDNVVRKLLKEHEVRSFEACEPIVVDVDLKTHHRNFKNKTGATTKLTSSPARSLRTVNKHMRR